MAKATVQRKIFVLDTSVILYDHNAVKSFQEHDVAIPITVLEELDQFKKGNDIINFEAREFIRFIDKLSGKFTLKDWMPINGKGKGNFCVVMDENSVPDAEQIFGEKKADHRILNAAINLRNQFAKQKRSVILVTKDVNLRLKAKSLDILAEDYETGKIKDIESLDNGWAEISGLDNALIDLMHKQGSLDYRKVRNKEPRANQYFLLRNGKSSVLAFYNAQAQLLQKIDKTTAYGISPRNAEQTFALHAALRSDIRLVTLLGVAGTGKTLLALAAALENRTMYRQIYLARPIVPLSNRDIGYLPGDIKSKINPYMEPLWDNLKFIQSNFSEKSKEFQRINEMVQNEKLLVTPLAYIRGRSISKVMFIVDEAQNLTPHEVKTIITRAGEDTKIIFTGDIYQIDTPYLDAHSNGLSYLIDKIGNHPLYAHVTLEKGERSELANLANELL